MLKKGIYAILKANLITFFLNLITSIVLPKYLNVESYAHIKTFQLFITYIGFFHFGYCDGMYLRYGGEKIETINKIELKTDIISMRFFQFIIVVLTSLSCIVYRNSEWTAFVIVILPLNMVSYYKLLCQAIGEYEKFGKIINVTTFLTATINIFLLFGINERKNADLYIWLYIIIDIVVWIGLEHYMQHFFGLKNVLARHNWHLVKENVKNGILLTLGNLSFTLFSGIDRLFVKGLMNTVAFAQYSFAVSIESFLNVVITPISITLYNFFCTHKKMNEIVRIKEYVLVGAVLVTATVFPAKWLLEHYLTNYIASAQILFYLFAAQMYGIIVKCIYINLYKVRRLQKRYFFKLIIVLVAGGIFNGAFYLILKNKEAFAIGTLCSSVLWLVFCVLDFKDVALKPKDWIYLIIESVYLIQCGYIFDAIDGFVVYSCGTIILTILFMRIVLHDIYSYYRKSKE